MDYKFNESCQNQVTDYHLTRMIPRLSIISKWYIGFPFHKGLFLLFLFLFHFTLPIEVDAAKKSNKSKVTINLPQTIILENSSKSSQKKLEPFLFMKRKICVGKCPSQPLVISK